MENWKPKGAGEFFGKKAGKAFFRQKEPQKPREIKNPGPNRKEWDRANPLIKPI